MINLSKLNTKELKLYLLSKSVYYPYSHKGTKTIKKLSKDICLEHKNLFPYEIEVIISTSMEALHNESEGYSISLDRNNITEYNKSSQTKLNLNKLSMSFKALDELGYIELGLGAQGISHSTIHLKDKFIDLLKSRVTDYKISKPSRELLTHIEIEDSKNTKVTKRNIKGEIMKDKIKAYKPTKGIRGMKALKDFLYDWNMTLHANDIRHLETSKCQVVYNMKFVDDLEHGGRMYCGPFQTLPSDMRDDLRINHKKTVELDFKTCHPRIIACLENYKLEEDFDPYTVISKETETPYPRHIMKEVCMACLYSEGKRYANLALRPKLLKYKIDPDEALPMIEAFLETNPYLEKYLYQKEQYKDLQFIDSEIARRVIKVCISEAIPILSYHDSFRVEEEHEDTLFSAMISGYVDALEEYMKKHSLEYDRDTLFTNCIIE